MANFTTHLTSAAAASAGAAVLAVNVHLISLTEVPWLIFLGVVGGMLPDIDADNSRPVRLLFNILALMSAYAMLQMVKNQTGSYQVLMIAAVTYLLVRYGVFALFNNFTVHRGIFHSILAALFFAFLMTCISHYFLHWNIVHAWLNGVFITIGFIVHLLLDEAYSVDLSGARMKKSFGTAMKLFSYNDISASALMTVCTITLYRLTPSPMPLVKICKTAHWPDYLTPIIKSFL
ncbi:MAG: metal-dependent hydrolase [Methylococcaceae bacterium]